MELPSNRRWHGIALFIANIAGRVHGDDTITA